MLDIRSPPSPKSRKRAADAMAEQASAGIAQASAELALSTEPFVNRPCMHDFVVTAPPVLLSQTLNQDADSTTWQRICQLHTYRHEKGEEN